MGRPLRSFELHRPYHVTGGAVDGLDLFATDVERQDFIMRLGRAVSSGGIEIYSACLMTTHHHLVLRPRTSAASDAMRLLHGGYARAFNERHSRRGAVWRGRFWSKAIEDDDALRESIRYVALNPVRAGIVERPEDWPWSTYGQAIGLHAPWPSIDPTLAIEPFGAPAVLAQFVRSVESVLVSDTLEGV